jgi:hypothetical protein
MKGKQMNKLFIYAGHTMRANIEGDAQLVVESLKAQRLNKHNGVYPRNFAEGEAYDLLAEAMENFNEGSLEKADAKLQTVISDLIMFGELEGIAKL